MNEENAKKLVKDLFENEYDDNRYLKFVNQLIKEETVYYQSDLYKSPSGYKEYISGYRLFGLYHHPVEDKKIIFAAVKLTKHRLRDRARVMQRNFAADLLQGKIYTNIKDGASGALIAFYTDGYPEDWRLSFVTLEKELTITEKGINEIKTLSPAKRLSFLVGKHEPSHTCKSRFFPLLVDENGPVSFKQITEVFHIETVTDEFFEKYKECFKLLVASIDNIRRRDNNVDTEFTNKHIITSDFSKKLLGQIVFLYFLQKKGWLGVTIDDTWGSGPKDFLRKLFEGKYVDYGKSFFDNALEPLFYEALNYDRRNKGDVYELFNVRIPFLNGGLFEPYHDYDWKKTDIIIEYSVFEKIFNTFDEYNFTVKEDEPMEREVAVDPEMLGKVFEKLIIEDERKGKGAFYTPRYIVHYMCQQSLIEYLSNHISIPRDDLEIFIRHGDALYAATIKSGCTSNEGLPESIKQNATELDELLASIKVADPAVGSGAFPVGMMGEIVNARNVLSATKAFNFGTDSSEKRSIYQLKYHAMEQSIYGADLEPSAVDIAKLRFWLSLIVDEENPKEIRPLPNLDNKIMVGNSLLDTYDGIKLFDPECLKDIGDFDEIRELETKRSQLKDERDSIPFGTEEERSKQLSSQIEHIDKILFRIKHGSKQKVIHQSLSIKKQVQYKKSKMGVTELRILQEQYFHEQNKNRKTELRNEINAKIWEIIEREVEISNNPAALRELQNLKEKREAPFFLWELYFSEIFSGKKPGFDCVIGNPPYISIDTQQKDPQLLKSRNEIKTSGKYKSLYSKWDIYIPFIELGMQLLGEKGCLSMIVPFPLTNQKYGKILRKLIIEKYSLTELVDLHKISVFRDATVQNCIPFINNSISQKHETIISEMDDTGTIISQFIQQHKILIQDEKTYVWNLTNSEKVSNNSNGLYVLGDFCYISYGLRPNADEKKFKGEFINKDLISDTKDLIPRRKYIEAKDTSPYKINRIRYLEYGTERAPAKFARSTFPELYEHPKMMINKLGDMHGAIDETQCIIHNDSLTACVLWKDLHGIMNRSITGSIKKYSRLSRGEMEILSEKIQLKYLLGIINSTVANRILADIRGGDYHIYPEHIRNLPIPLIPAADQTAISKLVDNILNSTDDTATEMYKSEIEILVKKAYNLK